MKRDPICAKVLATRLIPNVSPDLAKQLELRPDQKSLALISADIDDVTYTALDEATKKADCEVVYAKSMYAGSANANTALAGEIIGILAAPNPAEAKAGLDAAIDMIENVCHFVSANDDDSICYYAHCISRTGSYLSASCGIEDLDRENGRFRIHRPQCFQCSRPVSAIVTRIVSDQRHGFRHAVSFHSRIKNRYGVLS